MKNDEHGKVACLQQLSIGISPAEFRGVDGELQVVDGDLRGKKARRKQSEVQVDNAEKFKFFTRCIFEESVSR